MTGKRLGQASDQIATISHVVHQRSGNSFLRGQTSGWQHSLVDMELEFAKARLFMQNKIYEFLLQHQHAPSIQQKELYDFARHLDEVLFRSSSTEDYMNLDTLESRLCILIKHCVHNNDNLQLPQFVNSSSNFVGGFMPAPGMSQSESSKLIPVIGGNTVMPAVNMGNPLSGGSRPSSGGYGETLSSFPLCSGSSRTSYSYMGAKQVSRQVISAPGYGYNCQPSFRKMNASNSGGTSSNMEAIICSHPQTQNQQIGGQKNNIYYKSSTQCANGVRPTLHQKRYGLAHGDTVGGILPASNRPSSSHLIGNQFHNSNSTQQPLQQYHHPLLHIDGFGTYTSDHNGPRAFYSSVTSGGITVNTQDLNQLDVQAQHKSGSQKPSCAIQTPSATCQRMDTPQSLRSTPLLLKEDPSSSLKEQPFNHHTRQFQQQSAHRNDEQKQQLLLKNDFYDQSQSASNLGNPTARHVMMCPNEALCPQALGEMPSWLFNKLQQNSVQEYVRSSCSLPLSSVKTNICSNDPTSGNANNERKYRSQQQWLLFLRHAGACKSPEGKCPETNCLNAQRLLGHMRKCNVASCSYPRCHDSRMLINHYKNCRDPCLVCVPIRDYLQSQFKDSLHSKCTTLSHLMRESSGPGKREKTHIGVALTSTSIGDSGEQCAKRIKTESILSSHTHTEPYPHDVPRDTYLADDTFPVRRCDLTKVKSEASISSNPGNDEVKKENADVISYPNLLNHEMISNEAPEVVKHEGIKVEGMDHVKHGSLTLPSENPVTEYVNSKVKGVSLIELFTPEQIKTHIDALQQWVNKSKIKVKDDKAVEHAISEYSCQLCELQTLTFEPPSIYCTHCVTRIKYNAMYYTVGTGDTQQCFCFPCYDSREDSITVDGATFKKSSLEEKKNDEVAEESWVQCDKCQAWQHQICALFNGRRNDGGQAEYTCANCHIAEIEKGARKPLPRSAVLGAKDLPRTFLSDHIEQRLLRKLKHEKQRRVRLHGKKCEEVLGPEALVVRVVSSVDKKLEVKPRFHEIFWKDKYPIEFPYKSKAILLFQEIEGVEVCLFGMCVQEFGSECEFPNHRHVYISYLDSVKYFTPDIKTATGEALRTFVYHEILIGYLEYCKIRGFTSCYIWACPPLKDEDYILHCHPEIQKTPRADMLRDWYLSMLRKATKEQIVVDLTNLYDHFFTSTGECKAKVTAARLPYFDGDYWPGAAEDMIDKLHQAEDNARQNKKGSTKKTPTKRALKAFCQSDLYENASRDSLLMHKLGETIGPMKRDFILVHLQHTCTHCRHHIVSRVRWICGSCKNFQLCECCYGAEQKRGETERHPISQRERHILRPVEINGVPTDTKDKDENLESEFFDTRQAFLGLCEGNNYQFDTLRRAKHSSMMILYHLHNPTAPAFLSTCDVCHLDIEIGQGWHCEICPNFGVCDDCYKKDGCVDHPHELTSNSSGDGHDIQNNEVRHGRVAEVRKMLDLLMHASQCRSSHCQYPNCRRVKGLFRHGIQCKTRASGGCVLCKKMWYLLQLHSRACKEAACNVPRCRDLKEHARRIQQQSDSRRRAAVREMMRQRAAEVSGDPGYPNQI